MVKKLFLEIFDIIWWTFTFVMLSLEIFFIIALIAFLIGMMMPFALMILISYELCMIPENGIALFRKLWYNIRRQP